MSSSTCRARPASRDSSTSTPDSLAISILIWVPVWRRSPGYAPSPGAVTVPPLPPGREPPRLARRLPGVKPLIGIDDVGHELVPHHVVTGQPGEVHVVAPVQDVLHQAQAAGRAGRQIDLRDIAGDHDPRAEAEPGEEHFHLLRRGVLCLIEDDK